LESDREDGSVFIESLDDLFQSVERLVAGLLRGRDVLIDQRLYCISPDPVTFCARM
jgi:hypothetical protein